MAQLFFTRLLVYAEKMHRAQYPQYFARDETACDMPLLTADTHTT